MALIFTNPPGEGGAVARATAPFTSQRSRSWLGLVPFLAFLVLFLIVPAISVFSQALRGANGEFGFASMGEAFSGQNLDAFWFSITFSAGAAAVGTFLGTLLAYVAASITRPRWLRNAVTAFSGVAANMGGLPLAFAFLSLLGRQGLGTKLLNSVGINLYAGDFGLGEVTGLVTVYSYFNIPLMVLVILPAIDGLKPAWREACSSLGGNSSTYWRRVGLPVLAPSILGGFILLFANSFSAYATAAQLTDNSKIVPLRIGFFLGGDVSVGEDAVGYALAAWMIVIMAVAMILYWALRRRAERWQS
ncbi:MAG: ABC transporter permease subunit [Acidimicrobiia bacterium]|nr:ABC transporter permease subunit [Acidimicrobiia bacterium]